MAHTIYTVHRLIELLKFGMSVKVASFTWKHCKPCRISFSLSKQICVECQHSRTVLEICTQCSDKSLKTSVWLCYCSIDDALIKFIPRGNDAHWCTPSQWSHWRLFHFITGSIARSASRRYSIHSEADFDVFAPQGRHVAPMGVKFGMPNFTPIGATTRV